MRPATKGHADCACAGKHDFMAPKTPKKSSARNLVVKIPGGAFTLREGIQGFN